MWATSKNPDVICERYENGLFSAHFGLVLASQSLIIIINQPPPPLALPWPIRQCSHLSGNSILIVFAFLGSQIRHPVQKLWTLEVRRDVHPKLYLGVFLYFQSVFLYFRPLVRTRLSLLIQNVTLESEFGDLSPKLWLSGSFWCLHTKLHLGRIWGVFLVFPDRICVCLTSRADRARSEVSENHLGKWNRRSESKVMDVQRQAKSQYFCLRASLNPSVTSPT